MIYTEGRKDEQMNHFGKFSELNGLGVARSVKVQELFQDVESIKCGVRDPVYNYCLIKDLRFLPANGSVKRQILPKEKVIGQTSSVQTRTVRNGSHATNTADWGKF